MIAFPSMLVQVAQDAGMKVPDDPNAFEEHRDECPHFFCFCVLQLARSVVYHGEHFDNAKIIAAIPKKRLMKMTLQDFLNAGVHYSTG